MKIIDESFTGYAFSTGKFESTDNNLMLKSLLLHGGEVNIKIDDIKLKSNLTTNKPYRLTKKQIFLYNIRIYSIPFRSRR